MLAVVSSGMIALLLVGPPSLDVYVDWLWFGEVGFRSVWLTVLLTKVATFAVVAVLIGGAVQAAMVLAYRARPAFVPERKSADPLVPYRAAVMTRPRLISLAIAGGLAVVCGLVAQLNWATVQLFLHGGAFGIVDSEFGHDISFFVFDLPFYRSVLSWLLVASVLALIASLVTHYLFGGLRLNGGKGVLTGPARVQLAVLAGTFVLLKAVAYWFDRYELLTGGLSR
ncbi:putative membrane protein [Mycolicibacterium hippocampi]|uniref:Putative membrane protein n=1 Tax=Mycolicibacterium hippocampi TaxID=659824 RepID=A0A850PNK3_9MYCO|nr:putative membrane protein [Mycolicibacterium hippocampi]